MNNMLKKLSMAAQPYLPNHFFYKSLFVAYAAYSNIGTFTIISGPSMYPTFNETYQTSNWPDIVWVSKRFDPDALQCGDIVIFKSPLEKNYNFCKRIAALDDTFVYSSESHIPVYVPPGHFWALGDNPRNSHDSDQFGPVPKALITGVITHRIFPWSKEAAQRKDMTHRVQYNDPLKLLTQQFEQYKLEQKKNSYLGQLQSLFGYNNQPQVQDQIQTVSHVDGIDEPTAVFNQHQLKEAESTLQKLLADQEQQQKEQEAQRFKQQQQLYLQSMGRDIDESTTIGNINNIPSGFSSSTTYNPFDSRYGPKR